jgi:DNA-binding beta-propeller fold protein YncE
MRLCGESIAIRLTVGLALALGLAAACSQEGNGPPAAAADAGPFFDSAYDGPPPLETTPPDPIPPDKRKDAVSAPVVFDWLRGGVWTANGDVGTVTYADVDHQKVVQEVAVGTDVRSVALSPDGKWVAAVDRESASVALLDADSRTVRRTLSLGTHPRAAVWDAWDPRWLYVSVEDDDAIAVIDRTLGVFVHEVPTGRLPAGLAVSRRRHDIAVAHRIDGAVTLASLDGVYSPADQGVAAVDVPLADEPFTGTDTVPSGRVFGMESLAWAPDGNVVWAPHELLANHHPLQFQRNLFPAVSVVDLEARVEVQTDPANPDGNVAGRKDLFAAINIPDAVGNTSIVSGLCGAAIHPNGLVAWVIACASEDLLTFDVVDGNATSLLRNLPGDHPAGITLDDTGQRLFIVMDQSHSLLTLDTANGSLVGHAQVVGGPLALVAKDPVDPEMRAALKLFFGANSAKNPLPTTGNFWMACGGCHLDGFVSTNARFFEALRPSDPTQDATIAHVGLADMFSSSPTPDDPSFNPHDVLVAMIDQGGLVPDRTGADRTGQIDPAHPNADAKLMAQRIARVIARDLPKGPSWQLAPGAKPALDYDAAWCGNCHMPEYTAWQKSAHAHAAQDKMVKYGAGVEQQLRGSQYSRQCAGCHDPVSLRAGDGTLTSNRGITCLACHDAARLIRAGGNSDLEYQTQDWITRPWPRRRSRTGS